MEKKVIDAIYRYALQNAVKFKGKATAGPVIGKILGEFDLLRKDEEIMDLIKQTVSEINSMSPEDQKKELEKIAPKDLEKKKPEKKKLPELANAEKGKVITRIPPEPSKYNHIGHALSFLLNYHYAKKYEGKCILRFEDTNPDKATQEYVDAMMSDVIEFLDIKPDKVVFVSDDMNKFYELAEQLIETGNAYVCECDRDSMKKNRDEGVACKCREQEVKINKDKWNDMKAGKYEPGQAILRLKINLEAKNMVMRDPVIFRIVAAEHYRQKDKYKVWPMYDFENAVEEELCNITHILRSNEFGNMRVELQDYIKDLLGFKKQTVVQYGRFNIRGAITQGREIREKIESEEYFGWDDPRLVTLKALKRRGFVKQMFYELVQEVGLSPTQTNIDWKLLSAINRRILDPTCNRYFFMKEPVEITIEGAPELEIELNLHPENNKGGRKFKTHQKFFIEKKDLDSLKEGELYRLMDCLNFVKSPDGFVFDSLEYENYKDKGKKIMHWLPNDQTTDISIMMDDASELKGIAENTINKIKEGDVVQFERFGFCRLDNKDGRIFWFTHK